MQTERAVPFYELGCQPSYSGGGELVLATEPTTYVLFHAISSTVSDNGYFTDLGTAVAAFHNCAKARWGYPNDEGRPEHPLYCKGLDEGHNVFEVLDSSWKEASHIQSHASGVRIFGDQYERIHRVSPDTRQPWSARHFVFLFKEFTFECLAERVVVRLNHEPWEQVVAGVLQEIQDP